MARGRHNHIPLVVRPLDVGLIVLKTAILPAFVFIAGLSTLQAFTGPMTPTHHTWTLGLGFVAVAVAYIIVIQTRTVADRVDSVFATLRRRVVMSCGTHGGHQQHDAGIACRLTPGYLRAPLFPYREQQDAVSALARACAQDPGTFWFIEGASGCGKTRTALLLVDALLRDRSLLESAGNSYLYDLSASQSPQDDLVNALTTSRHEGHVVLIDNFHLVRSRIIRQLTTYLVDRVPPLSERIIVFFSRPINAWNLAPGSDVRLISEAKLSGHHLQLFGPLGEPVERALQDANASLLFREHNGSHLATATQLHMAQIIARFGTARSEIQDLLRILTGDQEDDPSPKLIVLMAIISALSMHRGAFASKDFRQAVRTTSRHLGWAPRLAYRLKLHFLLRTLRRMGFVPRVSIGLKGYVFHEAIAEQLIDRLHSIPAFGTPFDMAGRYRLNQAAEAGDVGAEWLISAEINDQHCLSTSFDGAMLSGAYTQMATCLARAERRCTLTPESRLQLAILLDRVGQFVASRRQFKLAWDATPDLPERLIAQHVFGNVEADHDEPPPISLAVLRENDSRIVSIVARYWELHLAAHGGQFSAVELKALTNEARNLVTDTKNHWAIYSTGRMHFDSLRHLYLSGMASTETILDAERSLTVTFLRQRLPTYEALHLLYGQAHFANHVLLPRLAIFHRPPEAAEARMVGLTNADLARPADLLLIARHLYKRARDEFWQYGDREAYYLQADLLNTELIDESADPDAVTIGLYAYEKFIHGTGFADMASYPHLYFFRWHILQYYQVLLEERTTDYRTADEHLSEARRHLQLIFDLDSKVRNRFGQFRAEVLSTLLDSMHGRVPVDTLTDLGDTAAKYRYNFELTLLSQLADRQSITGAELRTIFRFYPFVHQ